jgi:hypothetical protein
MIPKQILSELTSDEIKEMDFRAMGNLILNRTISLSQAVNNELLKPISQWLDDPNFMKKFSIIKNSNTHNWAKYKRQSRQWTKQQKYLAKERLKLYWQKIREKRQYRKEISKFLYTNKKNGNFKVKESFKQSIDTAFLSDIVIPFNPIKQYFVEIAFEFRQACKVSISDLLPWKTIIISELTETGSITLNNMRIFVTANKKLDSISKFQHLLQMDMDGEVSLEQVEHDSQIQIVPKSVNQKTTIKIKDKSGQIYNFDWPSLNDAQRNKIITDTIERKILCRSVDYE